MATATQKLSAAERRIAELEKLIAERENLTKVAVKGDVAYANRTVSVGRNRDNDGRFYINLKIDELTSFLSHPEVATKSQLTISGFLRNGALKGNAGRVNAPQEWWFGEGNVTASSFEATS